MRIVFDDGEYEVPYFNVSVQSDEPGVIEVNGHVMTSADLETRIKDLADQPGSGVRRLSEPFISAAEAAEALQQLGRAGYSINSIPVAEQNRDYGDEHQERA